MRPLVPFAMQPPLLPELFPLDLRTRLSLVTRVHEPVIDAFDGPLDAEILLSDPYAPAARLGPRPPAARRGTRRGPAQDRLRG